MTDEELRQLIASNARAIEAAAGERAELRQAIVEIRQTSATMEQVILRLVELQEGVIVLLSRLDEDRPTIFRKLNAIENKVDQLLQRPQSSPE